MLIFLNTEHEVRTIVAEKWQNLIIWKISILEEVPKRSKMAQNRLFGHFVKIK